MFIIRPKQGKGGKWRWHLYMVKQDASTNVGEYHSGMSSIQGYDTRLECERAARAAFGGPIKLETAYFGVQQARSRDFI